MIYRDRWQASSHRVLRFLLFQVKPIQIHHLRPRCNEVFHKLFLRIRTRIHLRDRPQYRVGTKHQINPRRRPFHATVFTVAAFKLVRVR